MAYVVTDNCIKCKYTDCVEVCPVDCFYETEEMVVIAPDECIDCGLCLPECPADAIYAMDELPSDQIHFVEINRELASHGECITTCKPPLEDAEDWNGVPNKYQAFLNPETTIS